MIVLVAFAYFVLGVCFGSFTNVLIYRMPNDISVVKRSKSFCPKCGHEIKWYDNIPLISYICLGGKCRNCKEKISIRYPIVELIGGLIFLTCFFVFGYSATWQTLLAALVFSLLLIFAFAIAYIDQISGYIPTSLCVTILIIGLAFIGSDLYFAITNDTMGQYNDFYDKIVAFCGVIAIFLLIFVVGKVILGRDPMGLGDVTLLASLSLSLGTAKLFMVVLFASVLCSIISVILIGLKKIDRGKEIPFGPYIVAGYFFAIFFGDAIINGIMSLF